MVTFVPVVHPFPLYVLPECGREDDQDGEYLESSHQHEQGAYPLGEVGQDAPRHSGANLQSECRPDVAQCAEGDGDGIGAVYACRRDGERADDEQNEVDREEGEKGDTLGAQCLQ